MSNKYKAGDKFVIEIESCLKCKDGDLYKIKGFNALVFDNNGLKRLERVGGIVVPPVPEIDWSKVAVDTPVLVRNYPDEKWAKRHFAKYEDGTVWTWYEGKTSFTTEVDPVRWNHAKLAEEPRKIHINEGFPLSPEDKIKLDQICTKISNQDYKEDAPSGSITGNSDYTVSLTANAVSATPTIEEISTALEKTPIEEVSITLKEIAAVAKGCFNCKNVNTPKCSLCQPGTSTVGKGISYWESI